MSLVFSLGLAFQRLTSAPATIPPATPPMALFDFELLNETGAAPTAVPNLRISVDAGATWHSLTDLGLTVARGADGQTLEVTGWADEATLDAAIASGIHYEQKLPEEPNTTPNSVTPVSGLFARRVGDAGPVNPALPGMSIAATIYNTPVGAA